MSIMKELCFNSSSNKISGKMTVEHVSKHAKTLIVKIDREKKNRSNKWCSRFAV